MDTDLSLAGLRRRHDAGEPADRPDRLLCRDDRRPAAGLGPINGVAILLPLAFALHLPAESALILLATVYIGCEYGGRISSILLNVPGDAAAIMTALDGYPMAQQVAAALRCRFPPSVPSLAH